VGLISAAGPADDPAPDSTPAFVNFRPTLAAMQGISVPTRNPADVAPDRCGED